MKYLKKFESVNFKVGDYVKYIKNKYHDNRYLYFRIISINNKDSESINKGIAIRPISNTSDELTYKAGDYINLTEYNLEKVPDEVINAIKYNL